MRILFCEWKKLLSFRVLWILTGCLLLINGYVQISGAKDRGYSGAEYRALLGDVSDMSLDDAEQYIQNEMEAQWSGGVSEYSIILLSDMQQEVTRLREYPDYLANIEASKNSMAMLSIWGGKDTFSYRNIQKTPTAYAPMAGTALTLDASRGLEDALHNFLTDILGIFLLFLIVSTVILKDREQGMMPLLYAMPNGRSRLFFEKLLMISLCTIGMVVLLYGENLAIGGAMYGFGDLSRPIQCINGLYTCNLPISVGAYLVLFLLTKITAFLVFSVIFLLICTAAKNNLTVYGVSGGVCGAAYLLYRFVPALSSFGLLHYLNPVQFVRVNEVFGTYCNINLFGYPFSLKIAAIITMAVLIVGTVSISAVLFAGTRNMQYRNISIRLFKEKSRRVHGQFYYVCYRSLILQKGIVPVLVILFAAGMYSANFTRSFTSDDIYYEKFTTENEGVLTADTFEFIMKKQVAYAKLEAEIARLQSTGNANPFELNKLYMQMNDRGAFERFRRRYNAIRTSDTDGELFYDSGYERLFGIDGNLDDMMIALFMTAFLVMLLSPYAAQDRKTDMVKILYATGAGKRGYWKHLLLYSAICGIAVSLLFNVPYVVHILQKYGTQGLSAPIQSICQFAGRHTPVTVGGEIVILLLVRTISAAIAAMLISILSSVCRSPLTAYVANISLFVLPAVLVLLGVPVFGYIGMNPFLSYHRLISLCS